MLIIYGAYYREIMAKKIIKRAEKSNIRHNTADNASKIDIIEQYIDNQVDTNAIDPDMIDLKTEIVSQDSKSHKGRKNKGFRKKGTNRSVNNKRAERCNGQQKSPGQPFVPEICIRHANVNPAETNSSDTKDNADTAQINANEVQNNSSSITLPVYPDVVGILPLRNAVVFPGTVIPLAVGRPRSQRLLKALFGGEISIGAPVKHNQREVDNVLGVVTQKRRDADNPDFDDLYTVGTLVNVLKKLKLPDGQNSLVVHGLSRFRVIEWLQLEPYLLAKIEILHSQIKPSKKLSALTASVRQMAGQMVDLSPNIPDEVHVILNNIEDPGALSDFLTANLNIPAEKKQELLETLNVTERLNKLSVALAGQLELLELSAKIQSQVSRSIDKTQREYYLQEQLKAIQDELGQKDQRTVELDQLKKQISQAKMPEKVEAEALRSLDRLSRIPMMSPEYSVQRNYIEWLCELPWSKSTRDKLDINKARRILNADHYDLAKVKKRILEFLAVRKLNPEGRSPILCLAGPPGVGKTSLGKSIARAMGRKFVRISLGGIRDEADIRGHRRTYIGAMPGRIIQELRKCGSNNPVFMLDELDKIGQDFRGDPAAALLEVLDPEQNYSFTDHFIEQPFDLSKVMFIGTANYLGTVPPALRDRLEVLELPGYTADEKLAIAKRFLLPRQLKENGLTDKLLKLRDTALVRMINEYTREAGVRNLERKIAAVCRSIAVDIATNKRKSATVSARNLGKILGPVRYESELALRTSTPGVATGLAYTPVGGEILFIESTIMPGSGKLILTGQLGDVMKESARTALSLMESMAYDTKAIRLAKHKAAKNTGKKAGKTGDYKKELAELFAETDRMAKQDIHIHVPEGAVPKDGPSAGIAIYTSLASLLLKRPVRADVAMTGEITLRGLVLPIGGLKEKLLAARQAGIKEVILPERNKKDLEDLPKEIIKSLKFNFVRNIDKVLQIALEPAKR